MILMISIFILYIALIIYNIFYIKFNLLIGIKIIEINSFFGIVSLFIYILTKNDIYLLFIGILLFCNFLLYLK